MMSIAEPTAPAVARTPGTGLRRCLVLGAGRSGTSMLAGTLAEAGYYLGDRLLLGNESNPKGFFEDLDIIDLNEDLLVPVTPPRQPIPRTSPSDPEFIHGWRWLAEVPVGTPIPAPPHLAARIERYATREAFCYKDPRLCYTLPAWRTFLPDVAYVCIFREPDRTARSILKFCADCQDEASVDKSMTFDRAVAVWTLMYRHVLESHRLEGDWLFLHYDQLLDGSALPTLEAFVGTRLVGTFAEPSMKRSIDRAEVSPEARAVYAALCDAADYAP